MAPGHPSSSLCQRGRGRILTGGVRPDVASSIGLPTCHRGLQTQVIPSTRLLQDARPESPSPTPGWLETPQATNGPIGSPEGQAPGFLPESAAWKLEAWISLRGFGLTSS